MRRSLSADFAYRDGTIPFGAVEVGTTHPTSPGWVFVTSRSQRGYADGRNVTLSHFSPARAREIAQALLEAAAVAEGDIARSTNQNGALPQ